MDYLWTPWRYNYVSRSHAAERKGVPEALEAWPESEDKHCVFCNLIGSVEYAIRSGMPTEEAEKAAHIIHRDTLCFVCLNAFPYSSGHLMIVPYQHLATLASLPGDTAKQLIHLAQRAELVLRKTYNPDGLNFGINIGESAGAGVADHLHMHGLPRWTGDTNFMTVTAETRVLPETLDVTWRRLRENFEKSLPPCN